MLSSAVLAGVLSASISTQRSVTTWLVFDSGSANRLTIEEPADLGGPTGTRPVGGVLATFSFDATELFLHLPLTADVTIDEIRVAGESFAARGRSASRPIRTSRAPAPSTCRSSAYRRSTRTCGR